MATAANYYAGCLSETPKAVAFILDQFSMTLKQAAEFQIGFSDRTLGKRLPFEGHARGPRRAEAPSRKLDSTRRTAQRLYAAA